MKQYKQKPPKAKTINSKPKEVKPEIIIYFMNNWKKNQHVLRAIEIIPTVSINFMPDWKFESIRLYAFGFTLGIGVNR